MRRDISPRPQRGRTRLPLVVAPAAAVVGSIALSLGATPAFAAETVAYDRDGRDIARSGAFGPAVAIRTATAASPEHVVALGDTISRIAAQHGLRTADLLDWNGLEWSSVIRPGDVIRLTSQATPAPAAAAAPAPVAPSAATHTVAGGDTAWAIASAHGVSVDALLGANGLDRSSVIFPGQTLSIPGASAPAAPPAPASAPAPATASAPIGAASHAVAAGDTVSAIAAQHGLGIDAVLSANGLDRGSIIYPGQSLVIPGAAIAPAVSSTPILTGLDEEQARNAQLIIQVGRDRGIPDRGIAIALATAMVESWIRNLDWGDRDSLGLFQQRPSAGWGSADQVRDAARSIAVFYGGPDDPNGTATRGLLDIPGWESMAFTDAAQAVQISAHPERYGHWEAQAYDWLAALG